jgi:hypothetical protein
VRGNPVRIAATDPRVFAVHKLWLSARPDREPQKRRRDLAQAQVVGQIVSRHLTHLSFEDDDMRMIPKDLVDRARPLFQPPDGAGLAWP